MQPGLLRNEQNCKYFCLAKNVSNEKVDHGLPAAVVEHSFCSYRSHVDDALVVMAAGGKVEYGTDAGTDVTASGFCFGR